MEYPEAVHKFQALHIWGPTTRAEIVEALVNEAVRRTMEQVTGRPERSKQDLERERYALQAKDEMLAEAWRDRDKALADLERCERERNALKARVDQMDKLRAEACRERNALKARVDQSVQELAEALLDHLPAKEARDE